MNRIKVDDLRGVRPGYDVRVPYYGAVLEGPFDEIESMTPDEITFFVGPHLVTLPREQEIGIFGVLAPITITDAICLWEDTVGDSGEAPTDHEIHDYAVAVLRSVKVEHR